MKRPQAWSTCSGHASGGSTLSAHSCGSTAPPWCRASAAAPRSRCRWIAPTTSRSRRRSICTPCATAPFRCCSSSAERFSCKAIVASRFVRCPGNAKPSTRCRSRCGRTSFGSTIPTPGGCDSATTPYPRSPPTSRPAACSTSRMLSPRCSPRRRKSPSRPLARGGPVKPTWDRARAIADAVLYEGYLLYPYRATSSKNQSRWQFGVVGPPGASDAGIGEDDSLSAQFLVDGDSELTLIVRFLQLQHRRCRTRCRRRNVRTRRRIDQRPAVVGHVGRGGGARTVVRPLQPHRPRAAAHFGRRGRRGQRRPRTSTAAG